MFKLTKNVARACTCQGGHPKIGNPIKRVLNELILDVLWLVVSYQFSTCSLRLFFALFTDGILLYLIWMQERAVSLANGQPMIKELEAFKFCTNSGEVNKD